MGKLLKVLVVFIFLFSILAFVMGVMNFNKRELLIGRTHRLEEEVKALAVLVEAEDPAAEGVPDHPEWDVDDVTDRPNDNPQLSSFWGDYDDALEASSPLFSLRGKDEQLAQYYKLDAEGNVVKGVNGQPNTNGKMDALLLDLRSHAKKQLERLLATREQLRNTREKLEEVAELLNGEKRARRDNLAEITRQRGTISDLQDTVTRKDGDIARLNREKSDLNDEITSLNDQIVERDQSIEDLNAQVQRLRADIKRLTYDNAAPNSGVASKGDSDAAPNDAFVPGVKGTVVGVDKDLSFVIVRLAPEAVREIVPADGRPFAPVEMMVRRKGADGAERIVTRIRIVNPPNAKNLAVADNVYGWEQVPVEVGDDVVY
ncbi:MAG: hypothetical protein IJ678_08570 [Kiritimatiellae bacterium]|nr:hypothetical protein [Kiritimatiellia bacterium]MBR1835797.1 hypothetical protein [Kiritimatiellia bacterium]